MKLDDGRLTFVAQQEVTALDAIHKAALGKAACAGRVTEGVGTCISIHAPTWGATKVVRGHMGSPYISIHAPTWGATFFIYTFASSTVFQSTHPRGVRRGGRGGRGKVEGISIHAPTWGATPQHQYIIHHAKISIHAPTWGATASRPRRKG